MSEIKQLLGKITHSVSRIDMWQFSVEIECDRIMEYVKGIEGIMAEKWIQGAINPAHKGALRKTLHVKKGEKIPEKKLEKAEHSKNPKTAKRAKLAENLKKMH